MSNNGKYITVDRVIDKVYRDYGFDDLDWLNAIEWVGECLDFIGAPRTYIEKITDANEALGHSSPIEIENNRGKLPCDMYKMIQAFRCIDGNYIPMRVNTDTTHMAYDCMNTSDFGRNSEYTYKLNNNYIFTSFEEGEVVLAYLANPTDERGYPMLPDNVKYVAACAAYVADKMMIKKDIQGKPVSPRAAQRIEQDVSWYISAADVSGRMPTIDDMESWKNNFIKLIPNIQSHRTAFRDDGAMERRFNNSTNESKNRI